MLTIGILNNMPDAAVRSTERQFTDLLTEAALEIPLDIKWFSLLPRDGYAPVEALWDGTHIDGLITTGTEPREPRLDDEPYWPAFSQTVEWASKHTISAIWSCLAAHAAVYYLDRIERQPHAVKLHGVFAVRKQLLHPLLVNLEPDGIPHSRWNDLPIEALYGRGYRVLTYGRDIGADTFTKTCGNSLFVFFQGHPEYDARALMREYRRDVLRYIGGERSDYPPLPAQYFDIHIANRLRELRQRTLADRHVDGGMVEFQGVINKADLVATWKATAVQLYRNWFNYLLAQQAKQVKQVAL